MWPILCSLVIIDLVEANHYFIILYFTHLTKLSLFLKQRLSISLCLPQLRAKLRCCFRRKLWLFMYENSDDGVHLFHSSHGCHDANAQAKENPCIVVQVVWWNNGVLDAVESKTWLAWPTGKLEVIKCMLMWL